MLRTRLRHEFALCIKMRATSRSKSPQKRWGLPGVACAMTSSCGFWRRASSTDLGIYTSFT